MIDERAAQIAREAAVAGFVAGNRYGSHAWLSTDSAIWLATLQVARDFPDLYPALGAIARESEELNEEERRRHSATAEFLRPYVNEEGSP